METTENRFNHQYLIRLDDELSQKLVHFSKLNEMTLTGTIRKSLRQFFQNEECQEPTNLVKNNHHMNENSNK